MEKKPNPWPGIITVETFSNVIINILNLEKNQMIKFSEAQNSQSLAKLPITKRETSFHGSVCIYDMYHKYI